MIMRRLSVVSMALPSDMLHLRSEPMGDHGIPWGDCAVLERNLTTVLGPAGQRAEGGKGTGKSKQKGGSSSSYP